jgi:tetratricopeptide (TPR) repeat protein
MPLSDLTSAWRTAVAALPPAERALLLAEADALHGGDRDDRRRALSCWLALRDSLDPALPADRPRILALFTGFPPGIEDLAPLARRALATGGDSVRGAASVYLGRAEADEGRLGVAEDLFRTALAAERGTASEAEYFALSSLATLCLRGNREFEALVLTRQLHRFSERLGEETRIRYALMMLAGALLRLGEWALLGEVLEAIDRSIEGKPLPYERTVRFNTRIFAARRALALGDAAGAEAEVEAAAAAEARGQSLEAEGRTLLILRARCAEARGRLEEAERHLLAAKAARGPRPVLFLEVMGDLVRVRFGTGGESAGLEAARDLLRVLDEEGTAVHGTGLVLETASALARLLEARAGDTPEGRRAYEAAARAVLLRIHEVDRCLRDLPELSSIDPGDQRILRGSRARFVRDHRTLLEHVRDALAADGRVLEFPRQGDFLKVCAWCTRILGQGDAWVPVAHYLPIGPDLPVSHGICPPCAEEFARGG